MDKYNVTELKSIACPWATTCWRCGETAKVNFHGLCDECEQEVVEYLRMEEGEEG